MWNEVEFCVSPVFPYIFWCKCTTASNRRRKQTALRLIKNIGVRHWSVTLRDIIKKEKLNSDTWKDMDIQCNEL